MKLRTVSMLAVAAMLAMSVAHAQSVSDAVKSSVADAARPGPDKERDASRKPAEVVAFAGIKSGDVVADIEAGGGYWTRIFSKVVGSKGHVYALAYDEVVAKRPAASERLKAMAAEPVYGGNIELQVSGIKNLKMEKPLDVAWTSWNYHDFQNISADFTANMNKAVFAALKSGGTYIVIDHAAAKGADPASLVKLHRADPEVVKKEVTAAGFKLEAESQLLSHAEDDHTSAVFDGAVRGKTDSFVLKFRKP